MRPASVQLDAHLTAGLAIARWSMSITAPRPCFDTAVRPAIMSNGTDQAPASISPIRPLANPGPAVTAATPVSPVANAHPSRSEEHTSELQSLTNLVCRLLLEKKKKK